MSVWVIDAGPLLFLAKLGRLDLLPQTSDVYIPEAAYVETQQYSDKAAEVIALAAQEWLTVSAVGNRQAVQLLLADMDLGEAEAIVLAAELSADKVVLDDMDARRFAQRIGLAIVGTVGLLLSARLRGDIPSLQAELDRLEGFGFWIHPELVTRVLRTAGELE